MASSMRVFKRRKRLKRRKRGLDRKNELNRNGSTPSKEEFFGDAKTSEKK